MWMFSEAERQAVYDVIYGRRDIRSYRPDPIPTDVLWRILNAAHHAPSVGFMQPWNFLLIKSSEVKHRIHDHFLEMNQSAAEKYDGSRQQKYMALKLQGILDAPLNLLITCDKKRGGPNVLGRSTMPETDVYSTCLAVQNLWLAAVAEGVGVGWMSIMQTPVIQDILGMPEHVIPVAYLTMGYPVDVPESPLLERVGWRKRMPLEELVFEDHWNSPARGPKEPQAKAPPPKQEASFEPLAEAIARQKRLTRPPGSLGQLEKIPLRLGGLQQKVHASVKNRWLLLAAGDHGITQEGVSAYRPEVTAKMVYQFIAGTGAVNAIARENGLNLCIADFGVNHDFQGATGIIDVKVARGTQNFAHGAAMTPEQVDDAIAKGRNLLDNLGPVDVLALGEMGIGNSTSAAAIAAALLDVDAETVVGTGTGVGPRTKQHKCEVVRQALALHKDQLTSAKAVLQHVGGFELAGLVGAILEAYDRRIMVVLDGFITGAAALVAARIKPEVTAIMVAGHQSKEPGHALVLEALGLNPLIQLDLALGEGSGAALAISMIATACRIDAEMCTFEEAGIKHPEAPEQRQ